MIHPKHSSKINHTSTVPSSDIWPAATTLLGTSSSIDGGRWDLELVKSQDFGALRNRIEHLAENSLYSNPFFASTFLEPASTYLTDEDMSLLCLSEIIGEDRSLKFFAPVTIRKVGLRRFSVLRVWSHPYAPLSVPLMDQRDEDKIVEELAKCLSTASSSPARTILFEDLPEQSAFSKLSRTDPNLSKRAISFAKKTRASVDGRLGICNAVEKVSGKRKQRLRKAREQLERFGTVSFEVAAETAEISDALANHLELESKGWKGSRQTSILQDARATNFACKAMENLARKGSCAIHSLTLNNSMVASMILMHDKGHYFPWKITYDEAYAKQSVGNLLLVHVNELIGQDPDFVLLDSLASDLNQTARRFWPDELTLSNIAIGIGSKGERNLNGLALELELIANLKRKLKKRLGRLN